MEHQKNKTLFDLPLIDISLEQLWDEAWAARRLLAIGGGAGLVLAVIFLLLVTPQYRAEMIISPASPLSSAVDTSAYSHDAFLVFMNLHAGSSLARSI